MSTRILIVLPVASLEACFVLGCQRTPACSAPALAKRPETGQPCSDLHRDAHTLHIACSSWPAQSFAPALVPLAALSTAGCDPAGAANKGPHSQAGGCGSGTVSIGTVLTERSLPAETYI